MRKEKRRQLLKLSGYQPISRGFRLPREYFDYALRDNLERFARIMGIGELTPFQKAFVEMIMVVGKQELKITSGFRTPRFNRPGELLPGEKIVDYEDQRKIFGRISGHHAGPIVNDESLFERDKSEELRSSFARAASKFKLYGFTEDELKTILKK